MKKTIKENWEKEFKIIFRNNKELGVEIIDLIRQLIEGEKKKWAEERNKRKRRKEIDEVLKEF